MDVASSGLAGDPAGGAVAARDLAVERCGHLPNDEGQTRARVLEEGLVLPFGFAVKEAVVDLDACCRESRVPGAVDEGVRVAQSRDHADDPGLDHCFGTRRGATHMRARLERRVERGALRAVAGLSEREDLGVRGARTLVPALTDDAILGDDHGAHRRVRRDHPPTPFREPEGPFHVRLVGHDDLSRGEERKQQAGNGSARRCRHRPSSPIPTFTVGPGISPGPPSTGCRGVADWNHRRWGVAPRPEDELLRLSISIARG